MNESTIIIDPPVTTAGMVPFFGHQQMTIIHSPQWSIAISRHVGQKHTIITADQPLYSRGNELAVGQSKAWKCHLSHEKTSHLLHLPQLHCPTHGQCKTRCHRDWGRCICNQHHCICSQHHAGWQGLPPCCQKTPIYIQSSLAPQVATDQVITEWTWPWIWGS